MQLFDILTCTQSNMEKNEQDKNWNIQVEKKMKQIKVNENHTNRTTNCLSYYFFMKIFEFFTILSNQLT